jgi:hypothetical protein
MSIDAAELSAALRMYNALQSVQGFFNTWQLEIGAAEEALLDEINDALEGWLDSRSETIAAEDAERKTDPQIYSRMDEAERGALASDYIMAFESIATGTLMYAAVSDPDKMGDRKKLVQMRGPKRETL